MPEGSTKPTTRSGWCEEAGFHLRIEYTDLFDPVDVECTLYLDRPLSEDQRRRLQDILFDWYRAATDVSPGQRPVHFMSEVGFLEDEGNPTVEWMVDLANAGFDIFQRL